MGEKNSGLHSLLRFAPVYTFVQNTLCANRLRKKLVAECFDLFSGAALLDLGCGPGDILNFLPSDISYCGVDYNAKYIASAKKRFDRNHEFILGDLREVLELGRTFDRIIIIGFLHHLNDDDAIRLLQLTSKALKADGMLIAVENVYHQNQNPIARFLIKNDRGQHVRTKEKYEELFSTAFNKIGSTIRNDLLKVPYSHIILKAVR